MQKLSGRSSYFRLTCKSTLPKPDGPSLSEVVPPEIICTQN